jgi:hypothetical protein
MLIRLPGPASSLDLRLPSQAFDNPLMVARRLRLSMAATPASIVFDHARHEQPLHARKVGSQRHRQSRGAGRLLQAELARGT